MKIPAVSLSAVILSLLAMASAEALPPPNDDFADAAPISGISGSIAGTNVGATREEAEPVLISNGTSVWYAWTAPSDAKIVFSTHESDFDTQLLIYAETLDVDHLVAGDDDGWARLNGPSIATFRPSSGTTYYIAVAGFSAAEGTFSLEWFPPPSNDDVVDAELISGASGSVSGTNVGATVDDGQLVLGDGCGRSIWYVWVAESDSKVSFSTLGSGFDTIVTIYKGTVGSGTATDFDDDGWYKYGPSISTFRPEVGSTYYISVDGYCLDQGPSVLSWFAPPANDDFVNAEPIGGAVGSITTSNIGATAEPCPSPDDCSEPFPGQGERSLWYRWVAPSEGNWRFDLCGSSFYRFADEDWHAGLLWYASLASFSSPIATFNNPESVLLNYFPGEATAVSFHADPGTEHYIWLTTRGGANDRTQGDMVLNWAPAPENDTFENAALLTGSEGEVMFSNVGASTAPVWFRWVAPYDGLVVFDSSGSGATGVNYSGQEVEGVPFHVFTGSDENSLVEIATNEFGTPPLYPTALQFDASAGQTYHLAVLGGYILQDPSSSETRPCHVTGSMRLSWGPPSVVTTTLPATTTTTLPIPVCGDLNGDENVTATDALAILRAAVGGNDCIEVPCRCDVAGGGAITASDALAALAIAVGQPVQPVCSC